MILAAVSNQPKFVQPSWRTLYIREATKHVENRTSVHFAQEIVVALPIQSRWSLLVTDSNARGSENLAVGHASRCVRAFSRLAKHVLIHTSVDNKDKTQIWSANPWLAGSHALSAVAVSQNVRRYPFYSPSTDRLFVKQLGNSVLHNLCSTTLFS